MHPTLSSKHCRGRRLLGFKHRGRERPHVKTLPGVAGGPLCLCTAQPCSYRSEGVLASLSPQSCLHRPAAICSEGRDGLCRDPQRHRDRTLGLSAGAKHRPLGPQRLAVERAAAPHLTLSSGSPLTATNGRRGCNPHAHPFPVSCVLSAGRYRRHGSRVASNLSLQGLAPRLSCSSSSRLQPFTMRNSHGKGTWGEGSSREGHASWI